MTYHLSKKFPIYRDGELLLTAIEQANTILTPFTVIATVIAMLG